MEEYIKGNLEWIIGIIITIFTGLGALVRWLYKILIKDKFQEHAKKFDEHKDLIDNQNQNYNKKFDETHLLIGKIDTRVLIVQQDTSEIKGSVDTIISFLKTGQLQLNKDK